MVAIKIWKITYQKNYEIMEQRMPVYPQEESMDQKIVNLIIKLLKERSVEDAETILYQTMADIKVKSKIVI
ncbi:hypothetical protein [Fluviicola sp.]|uniref:hypothetical protein n=1 Tax=Fluviicola sp. TaxID=1917219 RepID=UPI002615CDF6|nr:hypothetical protein [Fluviicola sp.]